MSMRKILNKYLVKYGYQINKLGKTNYFESLLYKRLKDVEEFYFIQIGANDGISFDPIYEFVTKNSNKIKGIAIEPLPSAFEKLQINYKKYTNIKTLNLAIHNTEKEMLLYSADPGKLNLLPDTVKGIASFDKDHHKRLNVPDEYIVTNKVPCLSLDELINKYQIEKIDLLQIDVEGYDSEIILNLDFSRIRPKLIHFEHGIETELMQRDIFAEVIKHLNDNDYQIIMEDWDAIAYDLHSFSKY